MNWDFILGVIFGTVLGNIVGIWLTVRGTFGKLDDPLPPPQRTTLDELAPVQGPAHQTYHSVSKPEPGTPEINLATIVPQLGMPELRTNYGGNYCMHGEKIRREEQFIFVPITNAAMGSGLVICSQHAEEVVPDVVDDPADV